MTAVGSGARPPNAGDRPGGFAAGEWALFLDIDGTLLDLADDPRLVRADEALLALLDQMSVRLDGAMALVSGRDLGDIDRIMAPRRCLAAGSHGAEIRCSGNENRPTGEDVSDLKEVADDLVRRIGKGDGPWIERKSCSVALHFRGRPYARRLALDLAQTALARLGDGYRILPGKDVFEIAPATADKGRAIAHFLACPPFLGRRPIFAGDDVTDEHGFTAVNRAGGLSIRIGTAAASEARFALPTPTALRDWLAGNLLATPCSPDGWETGRP